MERSILWAEGYQYRATGLIPIDRWFIKTANKPSRLQQQFGILTAGTRQEQLAPGVLSVINAGKDNYYL